MIGIQLDGDSGAVAVWTGSGAEVLGTGASIAELVALADGRGADCSSGVVGVPAWFNDEQRTLILREAKAAGISDVRLTNEPTAATLAYGASQAVLPKAAMVLSVASSGAFGVSVLQVDGSFVEILATNGLPELEEQVGDPLFAAIEPVVNQALSDAGMKPATLDAIILIGRADILRSIASQIEATWGIEPVEPPDPETAVACGAAVYGGFLESQ